MQPESARHKPVLLEEVLHWLAVRPEGIYVDATAGLGGHTLAIAQRLSSGMVIASDCDADTLQLLKRNTACLAERIRLRHGWFSTLARDLAGMGIESVDGLLADLGASYMQLTSPDRGFSFMADGPLDMRYDRTQGLTAAELVNTLSWKQLARLFCEQGEERRSTAETIARAIVGARPLKTTRELARLIERVAPRRGRLHPATRVFMALRRVVNREDQELEALLESIPRLVKPGGRAVIISFMSLEDRRVKEAFRRLVREGRAVRLLKHVVRPSAEEVRRNPSARSARLRAIELR